MQYDLDFLYMVQTRICAFGDAIEVLIESEGASGV